MSTERIDIDEHPLIILMGIDGKTRIISDLPTAEILRRLLELAEALETRVEPRPPRAQSFTAPRQPPEWARPEFRVIEDRPPARRALR